MKKLLNLFLKFVVIQFYMIETLSAHAATGILIDEESCDCQGCNSPPSTPVGSRLTMYKTFGNPSLTKTKIFYAESDKDLLKFPEREDQLAVLKRKKQVDSDMFFKKIMYIPFEIRELVRKERAEEDIKKTLKGEIFDDIRRDPFYDYWIKDMAEVSRLFCEMQGSDSISFWLGSDRGCSRYHVDNVPFRMLVTYAGKGTEWIPNEAANRLAFMNGLTNDKIIKDVSARQYMNQWDIAVFRGGLEGLLHRTPDEVLEKPSSILMRLDHPTFLK